MDDRIVRYGELVPCKTAFIDAHTPGSNLKENFTDAAIKLFRTLFESPIQQIFNFEIAFFLISSTVKTSESTCVG